MDQKRPQLRDRALDLQLQDRGYVVVPGAAAAVVPGLRAAHRQLVGRVPPGFHSTPYTRDPETRRQVHERLVALLGPVVEHELEGARPILGSFVTKRRGSDGRMPPHMDWTFVDERVAASLNFWVPLDDVDGRNGAMEVLPTSHRVAGTIRGLGTENPFAEIEPDVARQMVTLPMRAGDVLVHDHRLLHSSEPNLSRRPRLVAALALVPATAPAVHFRQAGPGELVRYDIDDRFFVDYVYGDEEVPSSARVVGHVRFVNPTLTLEDLRAAGVEVTG